MESMLLSGLPNWLSVGLSILVAVAVLLVMITIHEFGHYLAGKLLKFKISEFAIGFGKPIFRRVGKNGEAFSVRILPLGGYCSFAGDEDASEGAPPEPGTYFAQKPWKRLIVQFAGAFMNFLFSILVVLVAFWSFGQFMTTVNAVLPDDLTASESSGAEIPAEYKLQQGDILVAVNGKDLYTTEDIGRATKGTAVNEKVRVTVIRGGVRQNVEVLWRNYVFEQEVNGEIVTSSGTGLGITIGAVNHRFGFFESIGRAFVYVGRLFVETLLIPAKLITGMVGIDQIGGPITTIGMTAQFARMGFNYLLEIVAMIGISLAVFNLLPLPALDGAHMVFTAIEWVRGKPVNRKVENYIHMVGLVLLFALVITVDVVHIFT